MGFIINIIGYFENFSNIIVLVSFHILNWVFNDTETYTIANCKYITNIQTYANMKIKSQLHL